jgi:hypothetical protein
MDMLLVVANINQTREFGEDFCEYAKKIPNPFNLIGAGYREKQTNYPPITQTSILMKTTR